MEVDARLANRMKHAEGLWERYIESPAPRQLDKWLAETLRAEKRFGSQDRRFYSDILFSAARWVTLAVFIEKQAGSLSAFLQKPAVERDNEVEKFCGQVANEKSLWNAVRNGSASRVLSLALDAHTNPDFLGAAHQNLVPLPGRPEEWSDNEWRLLLISHGIPPAWSEPLKQRAALSCWGRDDLLRFLKMQNERPPLWIRLNRSDACSQVEREFESRGLQIEWSEDATCARVTGTFGVYQTDVFKAGLFEVQDWASQQIARTVRAQPGQKIWDACAGGGGKTVALASFMNGKGALYASDIREFKLAEARRRCQRAGFFNLRTLSWNGQSFPDFGKEVHLQGGFDVVLVDAPCSSSGTWRRNPDARLRIGDKESRQSLFDLQKSLLNRAALKVRPGGRLVYGTCSWCTEENESVIASIVNENNKEKIQNLTMNLLGAPSSDSDTMFAADLLVKTNLVT
jgi:16S rRNA (cytosine967-C5)-methyltransferase